MAESLLFSFAESLTGKLATAAVQEASLALGVHSELRQMKASMALIKGVLLDVERKNQQSSALSEWLRQVKHVCCDAEDIVDDFECEALRKQVVNSYDINTRLTKLASQRSMFALQVIDQDTRVVHVREMTHSHVNPSNVTGREHDKNEIIKLLVQDGDCKTLSVISIAGMGGLGKTTLAKLVFNETNIDECFQLKMWVCVSNDFELRNVLIKILNSAPNLTGENLNNFETEQLQNRLRNTLKGKKFLLAQVFPHIGLRSVSLPEGMNNEAFLIRFVSRCNKKLRRLPDSVCELQNLQTLNLLGCVELQELPKGIGNIISLRNLSITTKQVDFPDKDIAVLTSLEILSICYCHNLQSLFNDIQLTTLKKLSLCECESLKSVPFHAIRNLKSLVISACPKLELSMGVGSEILNSRLKFVILQDLSQLVTLPQWIQGSANFLQFLFIWSCINLKELPDWLTTLLYLKALSICKCPNMLSLSDNMHQLTNLEKLDMIGFP
ncbi:hypothetical protein V8G54_029978 [Vigna mungo]|uniref:Uncharacterized protein n=1 Tax=Vigna mungo TaxID=3915 RepID=A0AAQ3RLZ3_VIGMU